MVKSFILLLVKIFLFYINKGDAVNCTGSLCRETLCHEEYKTLACSSYQTIKVKEIYFSQDDTGSCTSSSTKSNISNLTDVVFNHCQYKTECKLSYDRDTVDDCNLDINKNPRYIKNKSMVFVQYLCQPLDSFQLSNIIRLSPWTEWSECDNKTDYQKRNRTCINLKSPVCQYQTCEHFKKFGTLNDNEQKACHVVLPTTKKSITLVSTVSKHQPTVQPIPDHCDRLEYGDINFQGRYVLPKSPINRYIVFQCEYGKDTPFIAKCLLQGSKVFWQIDISPCPAKSETSNNLLKLKKDPVSLDNIKSVSSSLATITNATTSAIKLTEEVDLTIDLMENILSVSSIDNTVNNDLLTTTNSLLSLDDNLLTSSNTSSKVLNLLKQIGKGSLNSTEELIFSSDQLAFRNFKSTKNDTVHLSAVSSGRKQSLVYTSYEGLNSLLSSSLSISQKTMQEIGKDNENITMYCYSFVNSKLFTKPASETISSSILDFTITDQDVENLQEGIIIKFHIKQKVKNPKCSFWDNKKVHAWSTEGCMTTNVTYNGNESIVECKCNHLTNFAVLLNTDGVSEDHVLSIISLIGCIISITSLSLVVMNFIMFSHLLKSTASKIMLNLCSSLLLLLLIFVFGVERSTNLFYCRIIATLIHYFTLSSFAWMAVTSVGLYRDVVRTFQCKGKSFNFIWISGTMAWGCPLVVAGVTYYFSANSVFGNKCIIRGDLSLIVNALPIALILVFNFSMYIPITKTIYKHLSMRSKYQRRENHWQRLRVTFACSVLFGLTWIFGLIAIDNAQIVFQYIFSVVNSLQGFFIFLFYTVNNDEVQRSWKSLWNRHCYRCLMIRQKTGSNASEMIKTSNSHSVQT